MNRDFIFAHSYNNTNYPTNQPPASREDFRINSNQTKKQSESDLFIFNGQQPVKDIYSQQRGSKSNLAFVPQRINKNSSQKAFPIIYNTYNDGGTTEPHIKMQNLHLNPSKPLKNVSQNQFDTFNENNYSDMSEKQANFHRYHQMTHANQFQTFQNIPAESEPQTAKFLQIADRTSNQNYFLSSPTESYRAPEVHFEQIHFTPAYNVPSHPQPTFIPQSKHQSRVVQRPIIPISPPNRLVIQEPQRMHPSFIQEKSRMISIPQQEYERYIQNSKNSKRINEQNLMCKTKIEELGQKQQFYWQQNMTLREQNQRLRDLVIHFERRQKELLQQRSEQKQTFQEQIVKYKESTLEEFRLLLERYKLELQKNK